MSYCAFMPYYHNFNDFGSRGGFNNNSRGFEQFPGFLNREPQNFGGEKCFGNPFDGFGGSSQGGFQPAGMQNEPSGLQPGGMPSCQNGPSGFLQGFSTTDWGDPHYTASGTVNGQGVTNTAWNDQSVGTHNLLDTQGFDLQSTTSNLGCNTSVAYNTNANIQMGANNVNFDAAGDVTVDGQTVTAQQWAANNNTLNMGGGETLTNNGSNSYTAAYNNPFQAGSSVSTTIQAAQAAGNSQYMNISTSANNVKASGYLVSQSQQPQGTS
jgi:hypothetical protein